MRKSTKTYNFHFLPLPTPLPPFPRFLLSPRLFSDIVFYGSGHPLTKNDPNYKNKILPIYFLKVPI